METLVAAVLAAAATAVAVRRPPRSRLALHPRDRASGHAGTGTPAGSGRPPATALAAGSAGLGVWMLVGGPVGLLLGMVVAVVASLVLRRLEPRAVRQRREQAQAALPVAADLLGACLAAGRPPTESLRSVAHAVGGPLGRDLELVTARLDLGADPVTVWRELADAGPTRTGVRTSTPTAPQAGWAAPLAPRRPPGPLEPLARTMARSLESGAPVADGLRRLADDLRRHQRAAAEQRARSVGVRAAAPLGLCFLPAFVLLGIVPSVVSAFLTLSW